MKKVWILEHGYYSDRSVVGVFSTKERAEKLADALGLVETSFTEVDIDEKLSAIERGLYPFYVVMLKDGTVETCDRNTRDVYSMETRSFYWDRPNAEFYRGKNIPAALNATVLAKSEKHAIKIANEIRTRMIAMGEWGKP